MTRKLWALALAASGVLAAQTPMSSPSHKMLAAGEPLLGFASEAGSGSLHPVLGTTSHPRFGSLLVPAGVEGGKVYLAPLQRYALVENATDGSMGVWGLKNTAAASGEQAVNGMAGVFAHPDRVAFSATGGVAVLFYAERGLLQVIGGLPAEARLVRQVSTEGRDVSDLAVTDDGGLLVAQFEEDLMPFYSVGGSSWRAVATSVRPSAWIFVARTRDLVVSDLGRKEIALLPNVSDGPSAERVLLSGVGADLLAATSDGDEVVAASERTGAVWEIPLTAGGRFRRLSLAKVSELKTLRDGHAFLFSGFPDLTVLRATASELHVGH